MQSVDDTGGNSQGPGGSGGSRPLVINPLLCFLLSKGGRLPHADLREILAGFYSSDQTCVAKEVLFTAVALLKIDGAPKLTTRRMSKGSSDLRENKNFDDLLTMASFIDDRA